MSSHTESGSPRVASHSLHAFHDARNIYGQRSCTGMRVQHMQDMRLLQEVLRYGSGQGHLQMQDVDAQLFFTV